MLNEDSHWRSAHPEVLRVRRRFARVYLVVYFPLAMASLILGSLALILQVSWWRIGFFAGIMGTFAALMAAGIREWKLEKPVRLRVITACPVCDARMPTADMRNHVEGTHPDIWRLVKQSYWLLNPGIFAVLAYLLVLLTMLILFDLPDSVWDALPFLLFVPIFSWMVILGVVGFVLDRTRLQPARESWRMLHP